MKDGLPDKIPGAGPLRVDMALESLPSTAGNEDRLRLLPPRLGKKKCGDPILSFGVGHHMLIGISLGTWPPYTRFVHPRAISICATNTVFTSSTKADYHAGAT